jgi:hypothetical protein
VNEQLGERAGDQALFVTADGYEQLRSELERVRTEGRAEMSERLREAREDGHLANTPRCMTSSRSKYNSSGGSRSSKDS